MKKLTGLLAVLVLLLLQVGGAFAQSSDYEIIDSFKKRDQSLLESIKAVQDLSQRDMLETEIGRLEGEYGQSRKLLAEGLYPENFDMAIATLRDQLKKSTDRLRLAEESKKDKVTIEEKTLENVAKDKTIKVQIAQHEEDRATIEKVTRDVRDLNARIQQLSEENTGLSGKIQALQSEGRKDKASIAKLKEMTRKLDANVRDRDELIVKMMDSLFSEYSKADLTDVQKKDLLEVARDKEYVSKLVATIDGNIKFVNTALLTPQDARQIRDQQRRLSATWDGIRPYLGKLYPDESTKARDITAVDGRLSDLKKSIEEATWKSINGVFTANNIAIEPFHNAGEMYTHLLAYLDGQLNDLSSERHRVFRRKVWDSPLKDQWLPVIPTDELSEKQRADIDERIALWDKKISALIWRWVLIGVIAAAILAMVVVLIRRKKKTTPGAAV